MPTAYEAFYAKVDRTGECWVWLGERVGAGYGRVWIRGRRQMATHVALELDGRPKPGTGMDALHSCDNPPCVNPAHLRWGSHAENMAEASEKNRLRFGETHPRTKLSLDDVEYIKAMYQKPYTAKELSLMFGVTTQCIGQLVRGVYVRKTSD